MDGKGGAIMEKLRSINFGLARIMHRLIRPLGLTPPQGRLLMELTDSGGRATVGELAKNMETPYSNVSNICARLLSMGLVDKSRQKDDLRSVEITFTEKGRAELDRLKENYRLLTASIDDVLSDSEADAVTAALDKLDGVVKMALSGLNTDGCPTAE